MTKERIREIIASRMTDEEMLAIYQKHAVTTTQCFFQEFRGLEGPFVTANGKVYIDLCSRVGSTNIGHRDKELEELFIEFVRENGYKDGIPGQDSPNRPTALLMRHLAGLLPKEAEWRFYFGQSGAEAGEAALKLAQDIRCARGEAGRINYICAHNAFHGRTSGILSFNNYALHSGGYELAIPEYRIHRIPYPAAHPYFSRVGGMRIRVSDLSADEYMQQVFGPLQKAAQSFNALIIEDGVQGEGGMNVRRPDIMKRIAEFCRENGILLILDAVQSGIGRTGRMFAFEHDGIVPDMVMLAKSITDGLPQSVMACRAEYDFARSGRHSNTNGGMSSLSALALANLILIEERRLLANVRTLSDEILSPCLAAIEKSFGVVHSARNLGFMGGIEFWDPEMQAADRGFRDIVERKGLEQGVVLLGCGLSGVRIMPTLGITREHLRLAMNRVKRAIALALEERAAKRI